MTGLSLAVSALPTGGALALAAAQWRARSAGLLSVRRACHELRGPLTAARLGLQLGARTGQLSPASLRALDLELGRAGLALDDLAAPALPALTPRRVDQLDLRELAAESVLAWRASAELQGRTLSCRPGAPRVIVAGDRLRLAQVTGNLIANALEHGAGAVEITCGLEAGRAWLAVGDEGPGLPAEATAVLGAGDRRARMLRRRAARRDGILRRGRHGAGDPMHGHGLAICTRIVDRHGGRLSSAPSGPGARLVVELPLLH